jgi:hypothetical protein
MKSIFFNKINYIKSSQKNKKLLENFNAMRKQELLLFDKDKFNSQVLLEEKIKNTAICLLCRKPNKIWIDFLNNFKYYKTYIVTNEKSNINSNNIIYIDSKEVGGFNHSNRCSKLLNFPTVTAWDKALYYFSTINTSYEYVWFIEDDCFFMSEQTLVNIDNKYNDSDLICQTNKMDNTGESIDWNWDIIPEITKLPPPYSVSYVQTCRLSIKLLDIIKEYANKYKKLFIIETMFNTLALQNNLKITPISELSYLTWTNKDSPVHPLYIYHHEKDISKHKIYRDKNISIVI